MLDQEIAAFIFHKRFFQADLAAFDLRENLFELAKSVFEGFGGSLGSLAHRRQYNAIAFVMQFSFNGRIMIVNTLKTPMTAKNRPAWSDVTSAAVLQGVNTGHFDRHYHDCNEYWLICRGKAKVWIDGKSLYIRDGDVLCIQKGLEHDVLELYEPLIGFHFEDATPPGGRTGHLHKTEKDAKGHAVPTLPVPGDFPKD